jgi:HlyD family secretion protein
MDLSRLRPSRRAAVAVAGLISVAVVALGATAVAGRDTGGGSYRTATVSEQPVDQVLRSVGSVEPVAQASVAFPVDGTVSKVFVQAGDTVTLGRSMASLDVDDLTTSLHRAEATLAQAELSLELALAGEDPEVAAGGTPAGGFGRAVSIGSDAELRAAQDAVLQAQQEVDAALSSAEAALANASQVCAESTTTTTTSTSTTVAPSPPEGSPAPSDGSTVCEEALQASLDAQRALVEAQQQLVDASDELTALLDELAAEQPEVPGSTVPDATDSPSNPSGSLGGGSFELPSGQGSADAGASSSPSAKDLIAYQKAVDAAALDVVVAQHAIEQSTIVSPIAGTVVSVGIAVGDAVTAGSATQAVVIVGDGGFEVTTSISVSDLPDVAVGQAAEVVPDGTSKVITGEVVRIGVAPESSGTTYAVTVGLDGDTSSLGNGSMASVSIVTESSGDGLAVPTSAVTLDGDRATVQRVVDGTATETEVQIGPIGDRWIAITDGLERGDEVVLADLDEPLPGSATDTSSSGWTTGTGGFPVGGLPGGFRIGG